MARTATLGRLTWRIAKVIAAATETHRARSLTLAIRGWTGHLPGQHVDVRLTAEDGYQTARSFSIASSPGPHEMTITVELIDGGEVSPYLVEEIQVGDQLEVRGPIGGYFVWDAESEQSLLLVGGGSGIAPLASMIRQRAEHGSSTPTRLLYSSRSPDDLIYGAELEALDAADERLEVIRTFTRERPAGWTGYGRRIDREMLRDVAWAPDRQPRAYVCGPTRFVEAVASGLVDLEYPAAEIRTERFGPSGA